MPWVTEREQWISWNRKRVRTGEGSQNATQEISVTAVQWNKMRPQQPSTHHHIKNSRCLQWMSAFQAEILEKIRRSSGCCPSSLREVAQENTKERPHQLTDRMHVLDLPPELQLPLTPPVGGQRASLNAQHHSPPDMCCFWSPAKRECSCHSNCFQKKCLSGK